jgi:hypothetical protein
MAKFDAEAAHRELVGGLRKVLSRLNYIEDKLDDIEQLAKQAANRR